MHKIIAPLFVPQSKNKNFILNLNVYRNAHYQTLNTVKLRYKQILEEQIKELPEFKEQIQIVYRLFPKTRRRTDIGNVLSIHQKFFEDALTEYGKIVDDNYLYVPKTAQIFGEVDPTNPRVEIEITEIPQP